LVTYCNFKGCTNKATIFGYSKEFKNGENDKDGYWHVYVNTCDEHWDMLITRKDPKKKQEEEGKEL